MKEFTIGRPTVRADFEAITIVGDTIILLSSNGKLYAFREGAAGSAMDYRLSDTGLGSACEFEGLTYDPAINSLLLACKHVLTEHLRHMLVVYRWSLAPTGARLSRLTVPIKRIVGSNGWDGLHPSDITIDPFNGNYVLIASRERALFEITPRGDVVFARPLPGDHAQAEGVAITRDSVLIVSDERPEGASAIHPHRSPADEYAVITLYRWPVGTIPPSRQ